MKLNCFFILLLFSCTLATAQDILLDKTVRAGELTLFQSVSNPNEYYYLSDKPKLAVDPATGKPQFSFLRYVDNQRGTGDSPKDEGEGGGIIHCVVEMGVTQEQLSGARQGLQQVNPGGVIKGPAIYSGGTIALISSVNDPQSGFARKVLGLGKAPILDGQKAAISITLTKLGAKVLWESFQTPTPDMSFSFEMDLKGYKSPRRAIIEANFEQIYTHQSFSAAAITRQGNVMLAGEINLAFEDLYKSGAIKVTTYNPDENLEKAVEDAYSKLTRMMFDPAGASTPAAPTLPGQTQTSMLDRAQALLNQGRKDALDEFLLSEDLERSELSKLHAASNQTETGNTTPPNTGGNTKQPSLHPPGTAPRQSKGIDIPAEKYAYNRPKPALPTTALVASYSMRTVRQRGIFKIDLNKYTIDNLSLRFDQNVGAINCPDCFKQINLDDPLYKQREISATLDGYNAEDFQKYINFVAVSFRKKHEDGQYTNGDLTINRAKFNEQGNSFPFMYGWKGDNNRLKWREYEYKTVWNFFGGATLESPWAKSDLPTVPLSPPYIRRVIDIELDQEVVTREGIRSAEVKVTYKVEGKDMVKQVRLNPRGGLLTTQIEVLLPAASINTAPTFDYEITWMLTNGSTKVSPKKSSSNLVIFADQM